MEGRTRLDALGEGGDLGDVPLQAGGDAVTLFGTPSNRFLSDSGAPVISIGPLYVPKTTELCAQGDTICNGAPPGPPTGAHGSYVGNGMAAQAASFAAGRL